MDPDNVRSVRSHTVSHLLNFCAATGLSEGFSSRLDARNQNDKAAVVWLPPLSMTANFVSGVTHIPKMHFFVNLRYFSVQLVYLDFSPSIPEGMKHEARNKFYFNPPLIF